MMLTKKEKCIHFDTCRDLRFTMCGRKWSENGCIVSIPFSNADDIRAMDDAALVRALAAARTCVTCLARKHCIERASWQMSCVDILLEWAKLPYKENTDG